MNILELPQELLLKVFFHLDVDDLLMIRLLCKSAKKIVENDYLWFIKFNLLTQYNPLWPGYQADSWMTNYKYCSIWGRKSNSKFITKRRLLNFKTRYLSWLQLDGNNLYLSMGSAIHCINTKEQPIRRRQFYNTLPQNECYRSLSKWDDIGRFVINESHIFGGTLSGHLCCWQRNLQSDAKTFAKDPDCFVNAHCSDVHACAVLNNDVVFSGSKDEHVKLWKHEFKNARQQFTHLATIPVNDRIWCLDVEENKKLLSVGSAACKNQCAPLSVFDAETCSFIAKLGIPARVGAGVSDTKFRNDNSVFGCGYDSFIRLYDLRTNKCEWYWEELYDTSLFCLMTDNNNAVMVGTARYGLLWVLDLRYGKRCIRRQFYLTARNSPVYSIATNMRSVYATLDNELDEVLVM